MSDLPASVGSGAVVPQTTGRIPARPIKQRAVELWGKTRTGLSDGLDAAGASIQSVHRRLLLVIVALFAILLVGAIFRSLGWPQLNYGLIALFGAGALYAFLSPVHVVGMLLVSGGVGVVKGVDGARDALLGYARLLGRTFLAFLLPLFLFAQGKGDISLGPSLRLILLAPIALLAMWLFGRTAPRLERLVFLVVPLAALALAIGNMVVPQSTLAGLGIPAWLRAARPQDDELARIELALEQRRNQARAEQLRIVRVKIEAGEALTPEDEALVAAAQADRVTLTGWVGRKYDDALTGLRQRVAARAEAAKKPPVAVPAGVIFVPRKGWSSVVATPAGQRLCAASADPFVSQCHLRGRDMDLWYAEGSDMCDPTRTDMTRFRGTVGKQEVSYRYVLSGTSCS
ncbi:hypothetical protein G4G27_13645 [Sphingomonas sp. So64.6b]|uniref:hypothetical protein n=1 Tax=Sphingomonas sp. So64.6b TaxID=2997354 RepID=UPI0016024597|nr:hypothetical protein [Sphingomonas sp. So64.6b]QNA84924.1 hypothetical protein G4G27_13645 [Sphingomonas sp. So64.6b]